MPSPGGLPSLPGTYIIARAAEPPKDYTAVTNGLALCTSTKGKKLSGVVFPAGTPLIFATFLVQDKSDPHVHHHRGKRLHAVPTASLLAVDVQETAAGGVVPPAGHTRALTTAAVCGTSDSQGTPG